MGRRRTKVVVKTKRVKKRKPPFIPPPQTNDLFTCSNGGLGDQIIMNGGINYLAEEVFDKVFFTSMCEPNVYQQIARQWEHNPDIHVHNEPRAKRMAAGTEKLVKLFRRACPSYHYRPVWWYPHIWPSLAEGYGLCPTKNTWVELFYCHIVGGSDPKNTNYATRYTHFRAPRNKEKEQELLDILNLPDEFCFVVDKGSNRKYWLDITPNTKYPIVKPDWWNWPSMAKLWDKFHIWDWIPVLERATEIYTMDTGWFHLIKQLRLDKPKYFMNNIGRPMKCVVQSNYLNDDWDNGWKVVLGPGLEVKGLGEHGRV